MGTLADRLNLALSSRDMTVTSLAKEVGVTHTAMAKVANGDTLNPKYILEIADALNVSPEWLKTGKGNAPDFSANMEEEEEGKHQLRVEVMDVYASAGNGAFLTGDLVGDVCAIEFENDYFLQQFQRATGKGLAIINVKGDSMSPTLESGDLLYVDTTINCYQGDGLYVFSFNDALYVKRLQLAGRKILVLSDNKLYDKWEITADEEAQFTIHGKVEFLQGKIRRV